MLCLKYHPNSALAHTPCSGVHQGTQLFLSPGVHLSTGNKSEHRVQIRAHRYRSALEYTQAPGWKSGGTAVTQPSQAPMGQGVHLGTAQVDTHSIYTSYWTHNSSQHPIIV